MNDSKAFLEEKIMKLSKVVCVLLTVSLVILIAAPLLFIIIRIVNNGEPLTIGFVVIMGFPGNISLHFILSYIMSIVLLVYARRIFGRLRTFGNPFCQSLDLASLIKGTSNIMIAITIISLNFSALILAVIVRVLALVIEYGSDLKRESDSIL